MPESKATRSISQGELVIEYVGEVIDEGTWEERKHLHAEAIADFERTLKVPFALSELLELPPHASAEALALEGMLPAASGTPEDEEDEEGEEEEGEEAEGEEAEGEAAEATV